MRNRTLIMTAIAILALSVTPSAAQCSFKNYTGEWVANDGGTYYVRVLGRDVWWLGMSENNGARWTNIFRGTRDGDIVSGEWVDVRGNFRGKGTMQLRLYGKADMRRIGSTGSDFAGTRWWKPCNDVNLIPQ